MSAAFGPHSSSGFILRPVALPPVWYHPEPTLIRLCDALGAELQEDVFAPNDVPSYDLALRDGWAVNALEAGHRKVLDDVVENGRTPPGSNNVANDAAARSSADVRDLGEYRRTYS